MPVQSSTLWDRSWNPDDGADEYTHVAWSAIRGEHRGLIGPGMKAHVGIAPEGEGPNTSAIDWTRYCQTVHRYVQLQSIATPAKGTVARVFVDDLATVQAGHPLVAMTGSDLRDELSHLEDEVFEAQQLAGDQALAGQL